MEEIIGQALHVVAILTGRMVVSMLTWGRWRGEALNGKEGQTHGAAGALSFVHKGQRVVTTTGQLLVGVAFYVLLVVGVLAIFAVA